MSESELLKERKIRIFNWVKKNNHYLQYLILILIVLLGAYLRAQPIPNLVNAATGEPTIMDLDSFLFLRYAEYIHQNGVLFAVDPMRNYPLGVEIASGLGTYTSYFVAYLHGVWSSLTNVSLTYVDLIYPIIAMAITSIFLFLLLRKLFNWKVAALSTLFLNITPNFLFRSLAGSTDHDILGIMFFMITIYSYVTAYQTNTIKKSIVFGSIAGITTALGFLTAGNIAFAYMIIGTFVMIEILLDKFNEIDLTALASWFLISSIILSLSRKTRFEFINLMGSFSTSIALLGLIVGVVYILMKKGKLKFLNNIRYINKLPIGAQSFIFSIIISSIAILIFLGPSYFVARYNNLITYALKAKGFEGGRWALTVAEGRKPFVIDWFGAFGKPVIYLSIAGAVLLFHESIKKIKKSYYLTSLFLVFLLGFIFTRYSRDSVFNGETTLASTIFLITTIGFLLVTIYSYIKIYYKNQESNNEVKKINKNLSFIIVWYLIFILAASSAIRLFFEFSIIISILLGYFFVTTFDYFYKNKNEYVKYLGLILIILILFSPFSIARGIMYQDYLGSLYTARASGPQYHVQWQYAGEWVKTNLPKETVFAHWWDYGYWVQTGFERATLTDGGNTAGWWNFLIGRHLLTGKSFEDPLKFLYAHKATHILIVSDEIGKYGAYSSIGSDKNLDRLSYIPSFELDNSLLKETRNITILGYTGNMRLEEVINVNGELFTPSDSMIIQISLPIAKQNEEILQLGQPFVTIVKSQNKIVEVPIKCLFNNGQKIEFKEGINSCFVIIPKLTSDGQTNQFGAGLFLSPRIYDTNFARLYIYGEENPYYKLVYTDQNSIPLSLLNGRIIGPLKIWEITYTENISLTEEEEEYFLSKTYLDPEVI